MRRRDLLQFAAVALAAGPAGCAAPRPETTESPSRAVTTPAGTVSPMNLPETTAPPSEDGATPASTSSPTNPPETTAVPSPGTTPQFRSSDGLVSRYRFDEAPTSTRPTGIVIYLHGDGHGEFEPGSTVLDDYAAVARDNGMSMLAPLTPDQRTHTWWQDESSGHWLRELIDHVKATHDIDDSRVWLAGYSGGAEVITNVLLPDHSDLFTGGGAVLVGGGSLDSEVVFTTQPSPQLKQDFVMTWVVGELDTPGRGGADGDFDALAETQAAEQAYQTLGMTHTAVEVLPGETHVTSADDGAPALRRLLEVTGRR
ncbi:hypothetical protein EII34_11245 [Arachnia propionica]|uniref:Esterase n=1 Tax=Arachnia propionica TaxID=1750 RepID=A0A3P1T6Z2_9ACTN|nr:hypothetical protein [Arachnia propionica]RRD04173.1 hypothetical protein EII34_11245 [Arachnia propionica]